jgi:hypothetical protein
MEPAVKKAKTTTSRPKKAGKDTGTCSLTKKEIGDRAKNSLALQKWYVYSIVNGDDVKHSYRVTVIFPECVSG